MSDLALPPPVTGENGELVGRLRLSLSSGAMSLESFYGFHLRLVTTFTVLYRVESEESRTGFLDQLQRSLEEHIQLGMVESFLIRATRDYLAEEVSEDRIEKLNRNRTDMGKGLEEIANDPAKLAEFRRLAEESNGPDERSDDEVREELMRLSGLSAYEEIGPELATQLFAARFQWLEAAATYLSDEDIARWDELHSARQRGA